MVKCTYALVALLLAIALLAGGCRKTAAPPTGAPRQAGPPPQAAQPSQPASIQIGQPAPDFTFTDAAGNKIALSSLKGKPVVLNFWASWCHFCAQEAPDLEALYQQYNPQGLAVLGVGTDDLDALKKKAKELGLTYPIGSDPQAAKTYGVSGIPHTFIIDKEGRLTASLVGARPRSELDTEIKKVL